MPFWEISFVGGTQHQSLRDFGLSQAWTLYPRSLVMTWVKAATLRSTMVAGAAAQLKDTAPEQ